MQNAVPVGVADRAVSRSLAARHEAYSDEVRRLVEAGYAVMRRTGGVDPRVGDIVREAGLSNQAFYRHFRGKDELLLAVLDDGRRRLVGYLEHRLAGIDDAREQVRAWIEGVIEQARHRDAAENTRPFALGAARLADRFPEEILHSRELVLAPLRTAVESIGGDPQRDADAIYELVIGSMNEALVQRTAPSDEDVAHLVEFALKGIGCRSERPRAGYPGPQRAEQ
ncbi:MAG: TetR/AcrR family transcriptional regulator [Actinomycetota bacterium]